MFFFLSNSIILWWQVHAYIINHLKKEMPAMFGKENRKKELIQKLPEIFAEIQREYQISPGDFPDVTRMQEQLQHHVPFRSFPYFLSSLINLY